MQKINKETEYIKKQTEKLNSFLDKANILINSGKSKQASDILIQAEKISEQIVNKTRLLPVCYGLNTKTTQESIEKNIIDENEIFVSYISEDSFYVRIPALLPKKNGGNPIYIRSSLKIALDKYFKENEKIILTKPSTIIFKHNYDKNRPEREFRDHDNIEINVIVDLIALYILVDDSPLRLRHFYYSEESNKDFTEVFIVSNEEFFNFLKAEG